MSRVIARPQADTSPVTKNARPHRQNTLRLRGNANHIPEKREVEMIFGGPGEVESGLRTPEKYAQKAKKPPQAMVHTTSSKLLEGHAPQPDDIVFTKVDAS